jgi:hypothetical protein
MMKTIFTSNRIYFLSGLLFVLIAGCSGSRLAFSKKKHQKIRFLLEAGANKGGIVENRNLDEIDGVQPDAFSGATRIGGHLGGRIILPVRHNAIETGLSYMYSPQTFTYNDVQHSYSGKRELTTCQLIVPLSYNIDLVKKNHPGLYYLKMGGAIEYNMVGINGQGSNLPDYSINKISGGITAGISALPISFNNGTRLGFAFDVYKGSQIYDDFYNRSSYEMPSSSYMKLSLIYRLK